MKKILILVVVVAVAVLAVGAPAATGLLLQRQSEARLAHALEAAPFLSVVEHTYHRGWFRSDETVTVEFAPGTPMGPPGALGFLGSHPRLSVHNTIHHGPLPGLSTVALATIDTEFVQPAGAAPVPAPLLQLPKLEMHSTLDFLGGSTSVLREPAIKDAPILEGYRLASDPIEVTGTAGRDSDTIDADFKAPHVLISSDKGGSFELTGFAGNIHSKRFLRSIYAGNTEFSIGDVEVHLGAGQDPVPATNADGEPKVGATGDAGAGAGYFSLRAFKMTSKTEGAGEFVGSNVKMTASYAGIGPQHAQGLTFEFAVEHLLADAFEKLSAGMRKVQQSSAKDSVQQRMAAMQDVWKTDGVRLLVNDPAFVLNDLEFATADGFAKIAGSVHLKGATAADFQPTFDVRALLSKLSVDFDVTMDEPLAEKLAPSPPGAAARGRAPTQSPLQQFESAGFIDRAQNRLHTKVVFANGALTLNGKPFGPPPAGGAPPPR